MFSTFQRPLFIGTNENDLGRGSSQNDWIDGKDGIDTVTLALTFAEASVVNIGGNLTVTTRTGGIDRLENVERLEFTDRITAYDFSGNAGQTYRLYQAAFGRMPDTLGLSHNIGLADAGLSLTDMASAFLVSAEFRLLYGNFVTNEEYINSLYQNVLGRAPDAEGFIGWLERLESGNWTLEEVLIGFSESRENHNAVDPAIMDGIELTPLAERPVSLSHQSQIVANSQSIAVFADTGATGIYGEQSLNPTLYRSDGSLGGTTVVKTFGNGEINSAHIGRPLSVMDDGRVVFGADDGVHGHELWITDTVARNPVLIADINPGSANGSDYYSTPGINGIALSGTAVLFTADDGVHGRELWVTDGLTGNTHLVKDINPDSSGSGIDNYYTLEDGKVVLLADDGEHGKELWVTDGSEAGTFLLKDISNKDGGISSLYDVQNLGNGLYAFTVDDGVHGNEIWISDGTPTGTLLLADTLPGVNGGNPSQFTLLDNGLMVFVSNNYTTDSEAPEFKLWVTDGTPAGTASFFEFKGEAHNSSSLKPLASLPDGSLAFLTYTDDNKTVLWKTDGTTAGTQPIHEIRPEGAHPVDEGIHSTVLPDGSLFFNASDGTYGTEFWRTDGTEAGTLQALDLQASTDVNTSDAFAAGRVEGVHQMQNGTVLLAANAGGPVELWAYVPTSQTATKLVNLFTASSYLYYNTGVDFHDLASDLSLINYVRPGFRGSLSYGTELWATDGTAAGTEVIGTGLALNGIEVL